MTVDQPKRPGRPQYRPEAEGPVTPDLFALIDVVDEYSLLRRLQQAGADVYCAGEFPTLEHRLRYVIQREQLGTAICGRDNSGKPENYAQAFQRVTGEPLVAKKARELSR